MNDPLNTYNDELAAELTISNQLGLHARSAAKLVQLIQQYQVDVDIVKNGSIADAKSILSLLTLECPRGTVVQVRVRGEDAQKALAAITMLINNKFGEE
jgi:phosphocarrier protein HPr